MKPNSYSLISPKSFISQTEDNNTDTKNSLTQHPLNAALTHIWPDHKLKPGSINQFDCEELCFNILNILDLLAPAKIPTSEKMSTSGKTFFKTHSDKLLGTTQQALDNYFSQNKENNSQSNKIIIYYGKHEVSLLLARSNKPYSYQLELKFDSTWGPKHSKIYDTAITRPEELEEIKTILKAKIASVKLDKLAIDSLSEEAILATYKFVNYLLNIKDELKAKNNLNQGLKTNSYPLWVTLREKITEDSGIFYEDEQVKILAKLSGEHYDGHDPSGVKCQLYLIDNAKFLQKNLEENCIYDLTFGSATENKNLLNLITTKMLSLQGMTESFRERISKAYHQIFHDLRLANLKASTKSIRSLIEPDYTRCGNMKIKIVRHPEVKHEDKEYSITDLVNKDLSIDENLKLEKEVSNLLPILIAQAIRGQTTAPLVAALADYNFLSGKDSSEQSHTLSIITTPETEDKILVRAEGNYKTSLNKTTQKSVANKLTAPKIIAKEKSAEIEAKIVVMLEFSKEKLAAAAEAGYTGHSFCIEEMSLEHYEVKNLDRAFNNSK